MMKIITLAGVLFFLPIQVIFFQIRIKEKKNELTGEEPPILAYMKVALSIIYPIIGIIIFFTVSGFALSICFMIYATLFIILDIPYLVSENKKWKQKKKKEWWLYGKTFKLLYKEYVKQRCYSICININLEEYGIPELTDLQATVLDFALYRKYWLSIDQLKNHFKYKKYLKENSEYIARIMLYLERDNGQFSDDFFTRLGVDLDDEDKKNEIIGLVLNGNNKKIKKYRKKIEKKNIYLNSKYFAKKGLKLMEKNNGVLSDEIIKELGLNPEDEEVVNYLKQIIEIQKYMR